MKTQQPASSKKQPITVKDLKARKNPKGGETVSLVFQKIDCKYSKGEHKASETIK